MKDLFRAAQTALAHESDSMQSPSSMKFRFFLARCLESLDLNAREHCLQLGTPIEEARVAGTSTPSQRGRMAPLLTPAFALPSLAVDSRTEIDWGRSMGVLSWCCTHLDCLA